MIGRTSIMPASPLQTRRIVLSAVLICGAAHAQTLERGTLDAGGGLSIGGAYTVHGTIGQPDVGQSGGGSYQLRGGFWVDRVPPTDASFADGFE
jgi:hypothetical protein